MQVVYMREWVRVAYPSESWKEKVSKMSEKQIIALYYDLIKR